MGSTQKNTISECIGNAENTVQIPDFAPNFEQCLLMTECQQDCWQNLFQEITVKLIETEKTLQTVQSQNHSLTERCYELEEQLAESQTAHHALMEASAAQARQFSEALKQLRQNQAQIVQTEKMSSLGQLVAGVAHEINNPVNFIYGNLSHATEYTQDLMNLLQLYQQYYPDPVADIQNAIETVDLPFLMDDLPKLLSSLKVGAERIQKIVLSLRSFSRMDEAEVKEVNIHEGLDSTLMILHNRLKAKCDRPAIEVIQDYGNIPLIECYAGQLNQVFMNLLSNAIDAVEDRYQSSILNGQSKDEQDLDLDQYIPEIRIQTLMTDSGRVQIAIADNGFGIPESVQQHLFDPFFTTKPVGKGTGLGLSISYQIITQTHRGQLHCISSPGNGAEFVIEIPVRSL